MVGGTSRSFGGEWLRAEPNALRWLPWTFGSTESRRLCVDRARQRGLDPGVLQALKAERSNRRPAALKALAVLEGGEAAVVVTGQQAGLLLGPLFTFHKALSTLAVAQTLTEETGIPCIPVFWVQDEDHDFAEVAQARWLDVDGCLRTIRVSDTGDRVSVGERAVPSELEPLLESLEASLRDAPHGAEAVDLLEPWRSSKGWSEAFCSALGKVFEDEGLLILRGRNAQVARAAEPYHRRAFLEAQSLGEALDTQSALLRGAGSRTQVAIRRDCSLSFFHPDGPMGARFRLTVEGDGFVVPGRSRRWLVSELDEVLRREPMRFSTSALLRPIVQDDLLPVAAQLVGPGEASYLAQMTPLRRAFGVSSPMIVPRGRARWLTPHVRRRLSALDAQAEEVLRDPAGLLARRASGREDLHPDRLRAQLLDPLERSLTDLGPLEPGLEAARRRTLESVRRNLSRFIGRASRARAATDALARKRLSEIELRLRPGGLDQERSLGLMDLIAEHGLRRLKACFLDRYRPFSAELVELEP